MNYLKYIPLSHLFYKGGILWADLFPAYFGLTPGGTYITWSSSGYINKAKEFLDTPVPAN